MLEAKYDEPLSNFAFNFNLRRYIKGPCTMHVVAYDGVYLRAVQTKTTINMLAGSRADVQIYCTGAGTSELKLAGQTALYVVASTSGGRGFHSSTYQLNLSRFHH